MQQANSVSCAAEVMLFDADCLAQDIHFQVSCAWHTMLTKLARTASRLVGTDAGPPPACTLPRVLTLPRTFTLTLARTPMLGRGCPTAQHRLLHGAVHVAAQHCGGGTLRPGLF